MTGRADRVALFATLTDGEHWQELRCRHRDDRWSKHWARTPEQADEVAHTFATAGQDVYVGVAPRLGRTGADQRRYAPLRALFVDCDSARAVAKLELFEPEPTCVVRSGGVDGDTPKRHAYWRLASPLPAEDARRHLRRLAHHLEADMAATDAARVLRVPGSRHHGTGRIATLERFTGEVTGLDQLTSGLEDPPGHGAGDTERRAKSTDELVELFRGHYRDSEGRHDRFRSVVGVLLRRCGDRLPPDVLLELAACWAMVHTAPCKDRHELERNFDGLLDRERQRRGLA